MPLSAVLCSGRLEDSGAAAGAMQASQHLGVAISGFADGATGPAGMTPKTFTAGIAEVLVAATGFAVLVLALIVVAVRRPRS